MELVNVTRMPAAYTLAMEPNGREWLVMVVKGTFTIPEAPEEAVRLAVEQVPIVLADELGGESGALPEQEADLPLRKARCDVLLRGSAYAPGGRPVSSVQVGLRVAEWTKTFTVIGDRRWRSGAGGIRPGGSAPFDVMPITYERAFGGVDVGSRDPAKHAVYRRNPIGGGFHRHLATDRVDGAPMPNTEQIGHPIERPDGDYLPMSFGPVGRSWFPRYRLAGTYDQRWLDEDFPFLPPDFDERYYQAAPEDQQIPCPRGGEQVTLANLSREGRLGFRLPRVEACLTVAPRHGEPEVLQAVIDTLTIEPDERRFTLCWRSSLPLKRSLFEIDEVIVGRVGPQFLRERDGLPLPVPFRVSSDSPPDASDAAERDPHV
jgi:hypothetical protein